MIINDLDGYYIVFDTKNWNTELDTLDNISLFFYYAGYWTGSYGDLRTIPFLYLSVSVESGTNSKPIFDNFFAFGYAGLYIRPVYVD